MATFGLRTAADQAGTSKSTILRAIQAGRLSAARTDDGGYSIDASELLRVFPPKTGTSANQSADQSAGQDTPFPASSDGTELRIRNAQLEAQIGALRTILEVEKQRVDEARKREEDLKSDRDAWKQQAERLLLAAPVPVPTPNLVPVQNEVSRSWWPWSRRSA